METANFIPYTEAEAKDRQRKKPTVIKEKEYQCEEKTEQNKMLHKNKK